MYADDICVMVPTAIALQKLLDVCFEYGIANDLLFNPVKSVCIVFKPCRFKLYCPTVSIGTERLTYVNTVKYLGFVFCENKKFERCHRLGNLAAFRRPVIVRFSNYKDKLIVWDAKFKLTDHRFSVSDNFSRDTEFRRRKLFAIYKKAKTMDKFKKKTTLNGDILVVDSVRYSIDNLQMLPPELNPRQFGEKSNGTHLVFGGIHSDHQPFTNWYPSKLCYKEHRFGSVEQAYQWAKATHAKDTRVARKLLDTTNPRVAKNLGRSVKGLTATTWDAEKKNIMKELVSIKFTDNADLKKELLDSNDLKLAEAGLDLFYG